MASRKARPVLYEVARRGRPREPHLKHRPEPPSAEVAPATNSVVPLAEPTRPDEMAKASPGIQVVDERVHFALSWPAIAMVLAAVVVALAVSFHAGTRYGQRTSTPADGEAAHLVADQSAGASAEDPRAAANEPRSGARAIPPATPPASAEGSTPARTPGRPAPREQQPPRAELQAGQHYVFIQYFRKTRMENAQAAAAFLRANGLPCTIQRARDDIRLIATEPFKLDTEDAATRQREKQRCEEIKRRIKQLGEEYRRSGGGYAFDQCREQKISE